MITKGVILDCAERHRLGINEVDIEEHPKMSVFSISSGFTAFKRLRFFIEDGKLKNKCYLIALRDFLNEIIEKE